MLIKKNIMLSVLLTAVTVIIGISGVISTERRYRIGQ